MAKYEDTGLQSVVLCRQCLGDLLGEPGTEYCGTCGLPWATVLAREQAPAVKPVPVPVVATAPKPRPARK